jgi:hypothetical protein
MVRAHLGEVEGRALAAIVLVAVDMQDLERLERHDAPCKAARIAHLLAVDGEQPA